MLKVSNVKNGCRLIKKCKPKETVEYEHLGGWLKKSTPHTDHKIIKVFKLLW